MGVASTTSYAPARLSCQRLAAENTTIYNFGFGPRKPCFEFCQAMGRKLRRTAEPQLADRLHGLARRDRLLGQQTNNTFD